MPSIPIVKIYSSTPRPSSNLHCVQEAIGKSNIPCIEVPSLGSLANKTFQGANGINLTFALTLVLQEEIGATLQAIAPPISVENRWFHHLEPVEAMINIY